MSVSESQPLRLDERFGIRLPEQTEVGNYFVSNYPPYSQWSPQQVPDFLASLDRAADDVPLGLYVHIPFCKQRCSYCYFRVHTRRPDDEVERYIDAVLCEAESYRAKPAVAGRPLANAYFGGGTPTLLSTEQIRRLLGALQRQFDWSRAGEVTCECQPDTVTPEKLALLRELGVTRASMGMQTLSDDVLRRVGRIAGRDKCLEAYRLARTVGFDEVNIDLIAGLPGETEQTWLETIDAVAELAPDCVTIYQLELTHNSPMFGTMKDGRTLALAAWSDKRRWVRAAFDRLERAGYTVYGAYWAVRDTSRPRFAYVTEHYWRGHDLLALGETAFGMLHGFHYQNADTFDGYVDECEAGRLPLRRAYRLSDEERMRRELILLLKTGGVDLERLSRKFGMDVRRQTADALGALSAAGLLTVDDRSVKLTRDGLLCVDWLLPAFYLPQHRGVRYT